MSIDIQDIVTMEIAFLHISEKWANNVIEIFRISTAPYI
jgi:hypothetical protein